MENYDFIPLVRYIKETKIIGISDRIINVNGNYNYTENILYPLDVDLSNGNHCHLCNIYYNNNELNKCDGYLCDKVYCNTCKNKYNIKNEENEEINSEDEIYNILNSTTPLLSNNNNNNKWYCPCCSSDCTCSDCYINNKKRLINHPSIIYCYICGSYAIDLKYCVNCNRHYCEKCKKFYMKKLMDNNPFYNIGRVLNGYYNKKDYLIVQYLPSIGTYMYIYIIYIYNN